MLTAKMHCVTIPGRTSSLKSILQEGISKTHSTAELHSNTDFISNDQVNLYSVE